MSEIFSGQRVVFVVGSFDFFVSHRYPIASALVKLGAEVIVISGDEIDEKFAERLQISHVKISMDRKSIGIFSSLRSATELGIAFRRLNPSFIHAVALKPSFLVGFASFFVSRPRLVFAITGLGFLYLRRDEIPFFNLLSLMFFRIALSHKRKFVIVQNTEDRSVIENFLGPLDERLDTIGGVGIDLNFWRYVPEPSGQPLRVVMTSRILIDKGVREFFGAAKLIRERGLDVEFCLAGEVDHANRAAMPTTEFDFLVGQGHVSYLGYLESTYDLIGSANIVVLPSYREGFPLALIEAAATGRAIVTTDVPGCRDSVGFGEIGVLIAPRDPVALADSILGLVNDQDRRLALGKSARAYAEKNFSVSYVIDKHVHIYQRLRIL